jgi:hypothetical protein
VEALIDFAASQVFRVSPGIKAVFVLIGVACLPFFAALGQTPVTLTVDLQPPGQTIPEDFSGLSFGTISMKGNSSGHFFDSNDTQVITLFQQMGIKYLRIGGTSVDTNSSSYIPAAQDVDALFRFANAAGVKVVYSLRLMNGDPSQDASMAAYIWNNYRQYLDCFAVGNEPDVYGSRDPQITNYSSYLAKWRSFAATITNSVPAAKFGGPDGGSSSKGNSWGTSFASDEANSGIIASAFFHYYAGASSAGKTIPQLIDEMLSTNWVSGNYPGEYAATGSAALAQGFPYRLTEANSYYTGGGAGVSGGNNCFASALFALDYMHWWTLYHCQGVCFHTSMWKYNGVMHPDSNGGYQVYPVGYGIKAFALGGHGWLEPVSISNSAGLNLTAYAVGDSTNLYLTIINKEHGTNARSAAVSLDFNRLSSGSAAVMPLVAPNGDPAATNGITLGGAAIADNGPWLGQWTALNPFTNGQCTVTVPATSAAVVKITPSTPGILAVESPSLRQVQINWFFGALQSATNIDGPYSDIPGAAPPFMVTPDYDRQFYRLREN